jgi:tartrate dehydrogenase/decarboxylase/D-malate dehydrogenase
MSKKRIAVIAGDGIGKEVMPEGVRVMEAAGDQVRHRPAVRPFRLSSWDYCEKHGKMLPDDWKDQIGGHDAIFFGAVGWPDKIPTMCRCGARCCCSAASLTSTSTCARRA